MSGAAAAERPSLASVEEVRRQIAPYILPTPLWHWETAGVARALPDIGELHLKLELFQHTGSFKPRGALAVMIELSSDALARGVTAVSAGNHAIGVAYAAKVLGTTAKVVIPKTASPVRIARARAFGAEVVLVDDVHEAFARVKEIEEQEGRTFVHPFEGPRTALGTATIGMEVIEALPDAEVIVVPVGGGGLLAGIAAAAKLMNPAVEVYGVEPVGADAMYRSFRSRKPEKLEAVKTIADSLGAPYTAPYSLDLCLHYTDDVVLIDDAAMCRAMRLLFDEMKLAVEPAGAAATAAMIGPLREKVRGKRAVAIVCGANIDLEKFSEYSARGEKV
jgi:threonine dehydratase